MTPEAFRRGLQASLALLNAGRAAEARPGIEALIAARPEQPDPYALLGLALDQMGDPAAGAQQLRHAIGLNPRQPQYRLQLARILAAGDPDAAEAELRAALQAAPGFPPAAVALADLLTVRDRAGEALAVAVDGP
ncbi:MAG TPA: tetratricopeptide repeat protein, partial [Caulobacteraceae bacterium]|nr:tetratricopeptide repeat protein [Caulobacteraceae bacterium]